MREICAIQNGFGASKDGRHRWSVGRWLYIQTLGEKQREMVEGEEMKFIFKSTGGYTYDTVPTRKETITKRVKIVERDPYAGVGGTKWVTRYEDVEKEYNVVEVNTLEELLELTDKLWKESKEVVGIIIYPDYVDGWYTIEAYDDYRE